MLEVLLAFDLVTDEHFTKRLLRLNKVTEFVLAHLMATVHVGFDSSHQAEELLLLKLLIHPLEEIHKLLVIKEAKRGTVKGFEGTLWRHVRHTCKLLSKYFGLSVKLNLHFEKS